MKHHGQEGVALNENDLDDIKTVVAIVSPLFESYPEGLIQQIFQEQQSKYNHLKDNIRCAGINCSFTWLSTSSTHQPQHIVLYGRVG